MRYLLDTSVISELARPAPSAAVVAWVRGQSGLDLAISALTLGELAKGARSVRAAARRDELMRWIATDVPRQFAGRIHPVDARVALEWGRLSAEAQVGGRPLPVIDGLLLATAAVHELTFVTRNESDCAGRGVETLNPWLG